MKIVLKFTYDADIISIPFEHIFFLKKYQNSFDEWIHNDEIEHPYWDYSSGDKVACFRGDAFVFWLNKFILNDSPQKAILLKQCVEKYNFLLPSLFF